MRINALATTIASLALSAAPLLAQGWTVGASAGPIVSIATTRFLYPSGGIIALDFATPELVSTLRGTFEVAYHRQGAGDQDLAAVAPRQEVASAQFGVRYAIPLAGGVRPYLTAGAGVHRRFPLPAFDQSVTAFGWSLGGGVEARAGGGSVFADARRTDVLIEGRDLTAMSFAAGYRLALSRGSSTERTARATEPSDEAAAPRSRFSSRFGVSVGGTVNNARVFSTTTERPVQLLAVHGSWLLSGNEEKGLEYTVEALPLLRAATFAEDLIVVDGVAGFPADRQRVSAWGVGILPIGVRGYVGVGSRVRLTAESSGGVMTVSRDIPNVLGRKFNFLFGFGAGAEVDVSSNLALTAGYRLMHYSTGERNVLNPGVDNGMLMLGVMRSR